MAVTVTQGTRTVPGANTRQSLDVVPDNSYPTGGYDLTQLLGLTVLRQIDMVRPSTVASAKYTPVVIATASNGAISSFKLAFVVATTGIEVAAGFDLSATSFRVVAEGN